MGHGATAVGELEDIIVLNFLPLLFSCGWLVQLKEPKLHEVHLLCLLLSISSGVAQKGLLSPTVKPADP